MRVARSVDLTVPAVESVKYVCNWAPVIAPDSILFSIRTAFNSAILIS